MNEQRHLRAVEKDEANPATTDLDFLDESSPLPANGSLRTILQGSSADSPAESRRVEAADLIDQYSPAFQLLDEYDHGTLVAPAGRTSRVPLDYAAARGVIDALQQRFPNDTMFGVERGEAFRGILGAIEQTFAGEDVYPSMQRKAAHLLYFVVKDHPFSDGNKRSAAALFTYYLRENGGLHARDGALLVSNNTLVALTLMTAMSKPGEKNTIIALLENMLAD